MPRRVPTAVVAVVAAIAVLPVWAAAGAGAPEPPAGAEAVAGGVGPSPEDLDPARPAAPAPAQQVWLELGAPADGDRREGRLDWVEVRGWAGVGTPVRHDIAVVVDVSGSTMIASGIDVDGDGRVGRKRKRIDPHRSFNPAHYSSDTDDSILAAELLATRRLVGAIDPERSRIGLISFSGGARVHARVGADATGMSEALDELERSFGSGATNMARATGAAIDALVQAGGAGREKTILLLSDGYPTAPGSPQEAAREALLQAERARAAGIRIFAFGLGIEEANEHDVYAQMATRTGGAYRRLTSPGEVVHELPRIDLADVADIALENATTGGSGQAVRVFPDGSFDGYLRLAAGENRIRVTARGDAGGEDSLERVVFFEPREPANAAEEARFQAERDALESKLELRALETRLAIEAQRNREAQQRQLEMEVEGDDGE